LILKPEEAGETQAALKALADARLIVTNEDSAEVAHEALIREWPTLRGWLEDNREDLRLHRHLTEAAQEWLAADREPDGCTWARLAQACDGLLLTPGTERWNGNSWSARRSPSGKYRREAQRQRAGGCP
jgi:hypothetical protein